MKRTLFFILFLSLFCNTYSQTTINLSSGESITDTLSWLQDNLINNTTIVLGAGTYSGFTIPEDLGTDTNRTLTFISADNNANSVTIIGNNGDHEAIQIKEGYITIKNITIDGTNTNNAITFSTEQFQGGNEAKSLSHTGYVTIDSCTIIAQALQTSKFAIEFNAAMQSSINITDITISNNIIKNGDIGIYYIDNYSDYTTLSNFIISNNKFENQLSKNICFYINEQNDNVEVRGVKIKGNDMQLPIGRGNNYGVSLQGIKATTEYENVISGNRIYQNNIDSANYTAISIQNCTAAESHTSITNNFIDIENTDSLITGINIDMCEYVNLFHNTIKLKGTKTTGIRYTSQVMKSRAYGNLIMKNNIIYSDNIVFYNVQDIYDVELNNNCYFSLDTSSMFSNQTELSSLFQWQQQTYQDTNSYILDPMFEEFNNPMFNNDTLDNKAPFTFFAEADIDGFIRTPIFCDAGAKEMLFINLGNDSTICYEDSTLLNIPSGMYSYTWSTGQVDTNNILVSSGTYSVTVQEIEKGAFGVDSIKIDYYAELIPTIEDLKKPKCFGENTGYIELTTTGGTVPYSYTWQGAFLDTNKIENLVAGDYYVTVSDVNNCNTVDTFNLDQPEEITVNFSSEPFCGGCLGEITAAATGGYSPYNYLWSTNESGETITDLCSGDYTLTIMDDSLCVKTFNDTITESELAYISGNLGFSLGSIFSGHARVELYKDSINGASEIEFVDSVTVEANGYFEFSDINPESFYLRGIITSDNSIYSNLYTSYYADGEPTTLWQTASLLTMECADTLDNINFNIFEVATPVVGTGVFSGKITYNNGSAKSCGEPVRGAEVFAMQDPNDEPMANTSTNNTGDWDINNIPIGTGYRLKVDIPGLPQISSYEDLEVTGSKAIISNLNFFVDTLTGGGIFVDTITAIVNINSQNIEIKTYPNPVSNYLTIETELQNNIDISYQIIDINGKEIITTDIENTIGKYHKTIDMSLYKSGTYFIKLKFNKSLYIKKFVKK